MKIIFMLMMMFSLIFAINNEDMDSLNQIEEMIEEMNTIELLNDKEQKNKISLQIEILNEINKMKDEK